MMTCLNTICIKSDSKEVQERADLIQFKHPRVHDNEGNVLCSETSAVKLKENNKGKESRLLKV